MINKRFLVHLISLLLVIISFIYYFDDTIGQVFVLVSVFMIGISAIKYRELLPFFLILLNCDIIDKSMGVTVEQYSNIEFKEATSFHRLPFILFWYVIIDIICRTLIIRGHNSNLLRFSFGVATQVRCQPQVKAFYGLLGYEIVLSLLVLRFLGRLLR